MGFVLAWLDSSERDRRRALDVIDLFDQPETVDELGIGTVRDAIAEALTPGTSTVQTRARYFFFIPWCYCRLESRKTFVGGASRAARTMEVELSEELAKASDNAGALGIQSGAKLRRLPSEVYWSGLGRLGFRLQGGSRARYHRLLDRGIRTPARDEAGDLALNGASAGSWNPHIPPAPPGFPSGATFELTRQEADFFVDQLQMKAPDSLLCQMLMGGGDLSHIELPWEHPRADQMSSHVREWLDHGRCYSELLWGAQLLYNLLLAEKKGMERQITEYTARIVEWSETVTRRLESLKQWDRTDFWQRVRGMNPRLPLGVVRFSEAWIARVLEEEPASLPAQRDVRDSIAARERELKGPRARLFSQAHLDLWRGASSPEQLNYRWWITRRIVSDIVAGLARK
jgi:hypothetical protein